VTSALVKLASRIRDEIDELERILARMSEGWQRAQRTNDEYYLDGVALNLHGFYTGSSGRKLAPATPATNGPGRAWYSSRGYLG
jgi:hypothetical protein